MQDRLENINTLIGFALFGILLLHTHGKFGVGFNTSDGLIELRRFYNIASKLFSIFVRNKAFTADP